MINLLISWYLFGVTFTKIFIVLNLPIAFFIKRTINKRYYNNQPYNSDYPGFRRTEKCVSFLRIYFGLLSFVYIKFLLFLLSPIVCWVGMKIVLRGEKPEEVYHTKRFKSIQFFARYTGLSMALLGGAIFPKHIQLKEKANQVYSKYLGPSFNYEKEIKSDDYSCVISNHVGWIDIFYLVYLTGSSVVAKLSVKKIPVVGAICTMMNHVFIDRGGNKADKSVSIKAIEDRQVAVYNKKVPNKLMLFPEGTGTNNTCIIKFKKGAFANCLPVKPYMILVHGNGLPDIKEIRGKDEFSLGAGVMSTLTHVILTFCYLYVDDFTVIDLPVLTPNDYLYEKYKHFGTNNAEIFMEATRHIMSEISGLPLNDKECYERKLDYLCKIKGKIIKST